MLSAIVIVSLLAPHGDRVLIQGEDDRLHGPELSRMAGRTGMCRPAIRSIWPLLELALWEPALPAK
jgi:hypothetical protein